MKETSRGNADSSLPFCPSQRDVLTHIYALRLRALSCRLRELARRAGAGARHGQLRRVRPRLLRICRASHRARASESSQSALAEAIADTELLVAAGLCWLTRTARRRCRHSWIRARLGLRTCAHCCCRTIAISQTLCACSAESARRCAQRGWLVTGTPVRALTPLRFFPSVRRLSACGASRAVFGPGPTRLQVPTVVELNALGTFAKMLYSISYGYAARTMRSWYFDYSRSIPCR